MQRYKNLWRDIIESISGTEQDFSTGRLSRAILLLSIPMVLEMMLESVFAIVDIFFVSGIGSNAVAIVGLTESMMTIIYAISMGLSAGTTAIVSRRIGEKQPHKASIAAVQSIMAGFAFSATLAIPGIFFAKDLLALMGASPKAIADGWKFTATMMGGNVVIMISIVYPLYFENISYLCLNFKKRLYESSSSVFTCQHN